MLHYLVDFLDRKAPEVLQALKELPTVEAATKGTPPFFCFPHNLTPIHCANACSVIKCLSH